MTTRRVQVLLSFRALGPRAYPAVDVPVSKPDSTLYKRGLSFIGRSRHIQAVPEAVADISDDTQKYRFCLDTPREAVSLQFVALPQMPGLAICP